MVTIDRVILGFAGCMVLFSLLLAVVHSYHWLWLTAFVGANLFQSSITGFCPLVLVLKKFGVAPGKAFE